MATVGVIIKLFEILNYFSAQGVEVNVAYQFQQIGVFLAQDGFIAILKQVAVAAVTAVVGYRITGQQATHHRGKRSFSGSQKEVRMIGD